MTTVYIIRHGQTDSNKRCTYLGKTDIPLNDSGIEQARLAAERFADVPFDAVYSSPLIRAVQTAQEIAQGRELNIRLKYGIEERDYGDFDDLTMDEIRQRYPKECEDWHNDWFHYTVPNGESAAHTHERTGAAIESIMEACRGGTAAVVTHLGAARHIIANLLRLRLEDTYCFALDNCRAAIITEDDNGRRILRGLNV